MSRFGPRTARLSLPLRSTLPKCTFPARCWGRRGVWGRRLCLAVLLATVVLAAAGWYATRPARLAAMSERLLGELTGAQVHVQTAHLRWPGHVELTGLTLRVPGLADEAGRLFDAQSLHIEPDLGGLLRGAPAARAVVAYKPTLHVTWLGEERDYNYEHLPRMDEPHDPDAAPMTLPQVLVRDGRVRIGRVREQGYHEEGTLALAGQLTPSAGRATTYQFQLQQHRAEGGPEPTVRGTFDLAHQQFAATLEHFRFTDQQRHLLPHQVRKHWDRLEPSGALPRVMARYRPDGGLEAEVAVDNVALNLPVPELAARLSQVSGRLVFTDDVLRMEDLTGRFAGINYHVQGALAGFDADAKLDVTVRAEPFVIPEGPMLRLLLPRELREHYERFTPSGRFAFHVRLHRDDIGAPLEYEGAVDILEGKGRYHKFPFPLQNARGRVRFTNEQAVVEQIVGRGLDGSTVRLEGAVTPPRKGAKVDMRIQARNVAALGPLLAAMKPEHQRAMRTFFNDTQYQQLVDQGVIRQPDTESPSHGDASPAPTFALGGRLDADVQIERPMGHDVRTEVTTNVRGQGTQLLFQHWPYPLRVAGGSVTIAPDHVMVNDLQLRGLTGAMGRLSGRIDQRERPNEEGKALDPNLAVTEMRMPVDELLVASVPSPQDRWVRDLHADGTLVGGGRVYQKAEDDIGFAFDAQLENVTARPFGGDYLLQATRGAIHLEEKSLSFHDMVARRDDAQLGAEGSIAWEEGQRRLRLQFAGQNLAAERTLLDLLPPEHEGRAKLADLFDRHQPEGRFDGTLTLRDRPAAKHEETSLEYELTLMPQAVAFDLKNERLALREMSGQVIANREGVSFDQLHGKFEGGEATISGHVRQTDASSGTLQLEGSMYELNDVLRVLLPTRAWQTLESASLYGHYRLDNGRLQWQRRENDQEVLSFDGRVRLNDAAAQLAVPVTGVYGEVDVHYRRDETADHPVDEIELRLAASQMRIANRLVKSARLELVSDDDPGALRIATMRGRVYDGVLTGGGHLALDVDGEYQLDLMLQDVRMAPLLEPIEANERTRKDSGSQHESRGRVDASLTIEGPYGDSSARRGRGAIRVREAELFDRPLTLALLQTANLTLPTADAFDRAYVQYMIDGERAYLEDIRFEAPTFAVIGAGTLELPSQALELTLVARNSGSDAFGALSDLINVVKDELVCIKVEGTLTAPIARMVSLEGLRESWQRLIQQQ